jgi:hypothetical protein
MKTFYGYPCIPIAIVVLVAVSVLFAGCSSQPASPPAGQSVSQAAPVTSGATGSASLPYGVSITVPDTWSREDVLTSDVRDYGKRAIRIARFTSPGTPPGDAASTNTLTIDIDQSPGADFEDYFNSATLAVEKTYGTQLDSHSIVKSSMLQISGYKSYELDFQTAEVKGSYLFTSTEKGMYVFAFKGPNNRVPVQTLEGQITDIIKSIRITPTDK